MSEKKLWNKIKKYLPGTVDRVENICTPGMPDSNGTYDFHDYWIELKNSRVLDIKDPINLLRKDQVAWTTKRVKQGAKIFILLQLKKKIKLFKACLEVNRLYYTLLVEIDGQIRKEKGLQIKKSIMTFTGGKICL